MRDLQLYKLLREGNFSAAEVLPLLKQAADLQPRNLAPFLGVLEPALMHETASVRAAAVTLLGGVTGLPAGQAVVRALRDESSEVRRAAVQSLAAMSHEEPTRITHALFHPMADVRYQALETLTREQATSFALYVAADPTNGDKALDLLRDANALLNIEAVLSMVEGGHIARNEAIKLLGNSPAAAFYTAIRKAPERPALEQKNILNIARSGAALPSPLAEQEPEFSDRLFQLMWSQSTANNRSEDDPAIVEFWQQLQRGSGEQRQAVAASILVTAMREGSWPLHAVKCLVQLWPASLLFQAIPLEVRQRAVEVLYEPRDAAVLSDTLVREIVESPICHNDNGSVNLHATGAVLHLTKQNTPYKWLIGWMGLKKIVNAFHQAPAESAAFLKHHDASKKGRGYLIRKICNGDGASNFRYAALIAATVSADSLDFLETFTPDESIQVFQSLHELSSQPGLKLNDNKLRIISSHLAGHISKRKELAFLRIWLAMKQPERSRLGLEIFSAVARTLQTDIFVSAVKKLDNDETRKLLEAITWCAGFPYALEKRLATVLLSHADPAVDAWANERVVVAPQSAINTIGTDTSGVKRLSDTDRLSLTSAAASDLDTIISPFLKQPHTGLCSALAECPAGTAPLARVACAVLGSNDPLDEIDAQFERFTESGAAFLAQFDVLMCDHWERNENISLAGNAWLYRWEKHTERIAKVVQTEGAFEVLHRAMMMRSAVLTSQFWQAVAHLFMQWRYRARTLLSEHFTPALAELLVKCLAGPHGQRAAKIIATVHAAETASSALQGIKSQVEELLPSLIPEVRFMLRDWVDSRGIEGVAPSAVRQEAPAELLADIDTATDMEQLQAWCRQENSEVAHGATRRLLEFAGEGERRVLAALLEQPLPESYLVLAQSVVHWSEDGGPDCPLQQAVNAVLDDEQLPCVRFRLGLGILLRDASEESQPQQALVEAVIEAACAFSEDAWLLASDWATLSEIVPVATLAQRWAVSPQPYAYRPALNWLLDDRNQGNENDAAANKNAVWAFLDCGARRLESLRLRSAAWLLERDDSRGFPILLSACLAENAGVRNLLGGVPGRYVEEAAKSALMAGGQIFPERSLLDLLQKPEVDELSRDLALQMLLREGRDKTIREAVIRLGSRPHVKSAKLRRVAGRFAWGVKVARELTGRLFSVQMISGEDLGYTRLQQPRIYINPLPILRDQPHGNDVVDGLILHELGHHMYHASKTGIEIFEQAGKEKMHGLLNLVSDEHLERNIRALDGGFGDKIKRLASYAFQHSGKETQVSTLLQTLKGRSFEVLTATPLRVARTSGCVKVDSGGLLFEMEKAGMSFARFFRALRMGLGDRHNDAKVRLGLALFKGKFRNLQMPQLLEIARQLRRIFGDETSIAEGFSQDAILCPNEGELDEFAEGISESELQSEIRRITDPRQLSSDASNTDGKEAGGGRWINVIPDEDFETITNVSPMPYDASAHGELAVQVRRDAIRLRSWMEQLGVAMTRERRRLSGNRLDVSRVRDLVLRNDPRILVSRKPVLRTDLFIGVVIDCSGSMAYEDNLGKAKLFATLIAEACRGMQGVDLHITGFTDSMIYECGDALRPAVSMLEAGGGNNDAAALWHAANVAMASRRSARLLVMISDGLPTECSVEALRSLVKRLTNRHKICCAQVAVQPLEEICFPHYVNLADESQQSAVRKFGEVVTKLVRRALSG